MNQYRGSIRNRLVSLLGSMKLTIVLIALAIVLVFVGTLAQVTQGIYYVQAEIFHSWFVWVAVLGIKIPCFPGGFLIGTLMFLNLIVSYGSRRNFTRRKVGIYLLHMGVVLLLVGEFLSALLQKETQMRLDVGESQNYSESILNVELAVIDTSLENHDTVYVHDESLIQDGNLIRHQNWPFVVEIKEFHRNSELLRSTEVPENQWVLSDGVGSHWVSLKKDLIKRMDAVNRASCYVQVRRGEEVIRTWLLSDRFIEPDRIKVDGKVWEFQLRFTREYKDFYLHLEEFRHDVYPGTQIPKNFSSRLELRPDGEAPREVLVFMNSPLRFGGYAFYQHSYANEDKTSILQVVRNPAWQTPYLACALVTLGMVIHFTMSFVQFRKRQS